MEQGEEKKTAKKFIVFYWTEFINALRELHEAIDFTSLKDEASRYEEKMIQNWNHLRKIDNLVDFSLHVRQIIQNIKDVLLQ